MEVGETTNEKDWKVYENCCKELDAIESKLNNGNLPEGEERTTSFQAKRPKRENYPKVLKPDIWKYIKHETSMG